MDRPVFDRLRKGRHRHAGCRQQFVAFEIAELELPVHDIIVVREVEIAVTLGQRIEESAGDAIGRFAVGEHLGHDDFRLPPTLFGRERQELARGSLP